MSGRLFFCAVVLLCALLPAQAAEHRSYASQHPHDLLQRSLKTPSAIERAIIRGHLASAFPDAAEGLFSAAWLAGVDGRTEEQIRLYGAAIEADPELTVAYINLALAQEQAGRLQEAKAIYDKALTTAPLDADLIRNGFFLRKEKLKDASDAERFLVRWEAEIGSLEYVFDFVRGLDAEASGRYRQAETFYQDAIGKDAPFEVYEKLAALRLNRLSGETMPKGERLAYVAQVMEPLMSEDGVAAAYLFIGRSLRDTLGAGRSAVEYLAAAFDRYPTAEAAEEVFAQMALYDFEAGRLFLERAQGALPDNYGLINSLAWLNYHFLADPDRAAALSMQALELAPHDEGRMAAILSRGTAYEYYGRHDEALAFYREKTTLPWTERHWLRLTMAMAENRIAAQEFAQAKAYLDAVRSGASANAEWLSRKAALVDKALALEASKSAGEPFLSTWRERFKEAGQPGVRFALNSDVIPARSHALLDTLAAMLKAPGNENAVLSIEGHTDASGNVDHNDGLSLRRARAVRNYLGAKHGIEAPRLQVVGYGSRYPVATNGNRGGRMQNRRVDMMPSETDGAAETAAARPAAGKGSAFSPDGRHAVFGQHPPQLWDLRANAKRHDLYRGRSHRFSPDGRYVSAISSFREEVGGTTEAVYVHDVFSGRVVAQLYETLEVVDVVWRPDSTAIAYSTADGFLKLYDIAARKHAAVTRMGHVRIGGPLAWLPDGKAIASGQHRMGEIVLWSPDDLAQMRRLEGVNWPHPIGASPDGRHLVAFDNRHRLSVWNTKDWSGPRQAKSPMIPLQLEFHPDRPWVVFNARFEASDISIAVMDFLRLSKVAQWSDAGTYAIGLSPTGETLLAAKDQRLLALDTASLMADGSDPIPEVAPPTLER